MGPVRPITGKTGQRNRTEERGGGEGGREKGSGRFPEGGAFTNEKQQTFWSRLPPGRNWRKRVLLFRGGPA